MKKLVCLLPLLAVLFASCDEYDSLGNDEPVVPGVTTLAATTDEALMSVILNGKVSLPEHFGADFEIGFEVSQNISFLEKSTKRYQVYQCRQDNTYSCRLNNLNLNTTYYIRAYMINQKCLYIGEVKTFKKDYKVSVGTAVNLGLSVKWATMNVGATKPEEYGDSFAWGETIPKPYYLWSTYEYCKGSDNTMTKYCSKRSFGYNGYADSKTILDPKDDAAHINWGGGWRMPTKEEIDELCDEVNCTWTWTTLNGVSGYKVQSNKSGYTGNWIFLPAAGYRNNSNLNYIGSYGYFWSSSLSTGYPPYAFYLYFTSSYVYSSNYDRLYGLSVRPVCP